MTEQGSIITASEIIETQNKVDKLFSYIKGNEYIPIEELALDGVASCIGLRAEGGGV